MEDKCSVWVGSLPLNCKEETLSEYFGKFGPLKSVVVCRDELGKSKRFGYVNYFGREIAQCAASVMDGFQLFNQSIKTKGPNELEALKNVQNTAAKTDYRSITDCLYFVDGRQCTWKEGEVGKTNFVILFDSAFFLSHFVLCYLAFRLITNENVQVLSATCTSTRGGSVLQLGNA